MVQSVRSRIEGRNCDGAVGLLKEGLKAGYPEVALLAGSMHEQGICVKPDWDTAITFYIQAYQGGLPLAAERLAAGYADPANGPDVAAALWWGLRDRGGARYASCVVSAAAQQDPDRFVAELTTWERGKLALCNYMVGVISTISAEVKYPRRAQRLGRDGEVVLRFLPAAPRIDLGEGADGGDTLPDKAATRAGFETTLREAANRALRRYPQPPGIPASTEASVRYVFELR
ncbi:hypothetical protein [Massilia sp.]|uniref:hypothetical protein n=1 Tax=Massilia sp. TaxID=1882437 RepID=UPI00391AE7F8